MWSFSGVGNKKHQTHPDGKINFASSNSGVFFFYENTVSHHYLSFVVLVGGATVELQLRVGVITLIVLAHPGDEGEVLGVLHAERAREQEVHKVAVLEGEAKVVEVAQDEGVRLDRRGLDDAVEKIPFAVALEDASGDKLGAVMAAVTLANLKQQDNLSKSMLPKDLEPSEGKCA